MNQVRNVVLLVASIALLGVGCGQERPGSGEGVIVDLHTRGIAWESTNTPLIARDADGTLYVLWQARADKQIGNRADMPTIPPELMNGSWDQQSDNAIGVSVCQRAEWLTPNVLTDANVHCSAEFAWCSGGDLNVLVTMADHRIYHLRFDAGRKQWHSTVLPGSYRFWPEPLEIYERQGRVHMGGLLNEIALLLVLRR